MLRTLRSFPGIRVLAAILFIVLTVGAAAQPRPVRINLGTLAPRGSSYHQALQAMGETWRAAGVRLVIYPDGTQGSEADMVRLMRIGTLQAGLLTATGLAAIEPGVTGLQNMPLVFRTLDEFEATAEALRPRLEERMRATGFEALFWVDAGWVHWFSTEPVLTPADLARHKVFVWSDPRQVAILQGIGQRPVPLESSDIPAALQTGLITALPAPPILVLAGQLDRQVKHMLRLNYAPLVGAAVITVAVWERIPADQRPALRAAAEEAGRAIRERSRRESEEAVVALQKRGLTVNEVGPNELRAWEATVEPVYPQIRGGLVPAEVFDEVRALVARRRAEPVAQP